MANGRGLKIDVRREPFTLSRTSSRAVRWAHCQPRAWPPPFFSGGTFFAKCDVDGQTHNDKRLSQQPPALAVPGRAEWAVVCGLGLGDGDHRPGVCGAFRLGDPAHRRESSAAIQHAGNHPHPGRRPAVKADGAGSGIVVLEYSVELIMPALPARLMPMANG